MTRRGQRYETATSLLEEDHAYEPEEAVSLVKKTATAKFDETVELHLRTGADPRHADQQVRGIAVLPHGIGKPVRVLVFAQGEVIAAAKDSGADFVGDDDVIKKIEDGWTDFDVSIATPDMMGRVGKLGRILGRRGLMPNPRTGTVVPAEDIPRAIDEAKKGRVEYRLDRTSLMHMPIGRASFEESQLLENMNTLVQNIVRARPSGVKGQFIKSAYLTSTMGPSVKLNVASTTTLDVE
jgi:large subunit ribosomal protein L1